MKKAACLALLAIPPLWGQIAESSSVGELPSDRIPTDVAGEERNPFSKREQKVAEQAEESDSESEESRIRKALEAMAVVGRTKTPDGWKVLLGNLILEPGKPLPPIIENQTQKLQVANIYDSSVEIVWMETDRGTEARRMFIPISLTTQVRSVVQRPAGADESQQTGSR